MANPDVAIFGSTALGQQVKQITLRAGTLTARILTYGAILQELRLEGVAHSLTLGSQSLQDYEGDLLYHGAIIAPVVNRLSGAQAKIDGKIHRFEANLNGQHSLHSGGAGTHHKVWQVIEAREDAVTLGLDLPAGEGGFPGNRRMAARFAVLPPATLRLEIITTTDAATIVNAANHSYWNLDGTPSFAGHELQIDAVSYLPTGADFRPTGQIAPTAGTAFDFAEARAIAPGKPDMDNCFCLATSRGVMREVLQLRGKSGLRMTVATTEPGVQVFDACHVMRPGQQCHEGLAIETQGWPDAPCHPNFPTIELAAGYEMRQATEWRFSHD